MSGNLHVDTDTLRADAARLDSLPMDPVPTQVMPLCALPAAQHAAAALNANAEKFYACQQQLSGLRDAYAAALRNAADVYDAADASAAGSLQGAASRFDGGGGGAGMDIPAIPPAIPVPNIPLGADTGANAGAALGGLPDNGFGTVPDTQAAISAPDQGGSLSAAVATWQTQAATLNSSAAGMPTSPAMWEGDAAIAAYDGIQRLQAATSDLASSWQRLAEKGSTLLPNHAALSSNHAEVFNSYTELMAQRVQYASMGNAEAVMQIDMALAQAQKQSEEIRTEYGRAAATEAVPAPEVPRGPGASGAPVQAQKKNEPGPQKSPRPTSTPPQDNPAQPPSKAATPASSRGQGSPQPPPSAAPQQPPSAASAPQSAAKGASEAASQAAQKAAGGAPSGGSGGSPGGGQSPGGMPKMPGGMPKMPGGAPGGDKAGGSKGAGPKPFSLPVRPAGAGGGGAGKGAGGGGAGKGGGGAGRGGGAGGGGMGARPLSPAITAAGVAPAAAGEGVGGVAPAARGSTAGGAGGGGPMGGHGAAGQGKEKKRRPDLTPDESIYTEDRAWTEGVVGHRRREVRPSNPEGGQ